RRLGADRGGGVAAAGEDVDELQGAPARHPEDGDGGGAQDDEPAAAPGPAHPRVLVTPDPVLAAHARRSQHAHGRSVVRSGGNAYQMIIRLRACACERTRKGQTAFGVVGCEVFRPARGRSVQLEDAGVQDLALLQGRADGAVQAVLQVQVALPLHDVREEVAVERRVLGEQGLEVELLLGRHELIEADRARRHVRPLPGAFPAVVGVRPAVSDALEDHTESLPVKSFPAQPWRRSATLEMTSESRAYRKRGPLWVSVRRRGRPSPPRPPAAPPPCRGLRCGSPPVTPSPAPRSTWAPCCGTASATPTPASGCPCRCSTGTAWSRAPRAPARPRRCS